MRTRGWQCAFCTRSVREEGVEPLEIYLSWTHSGPDPVGQQFWPHSACLLHALHPSVAGLAVWEGATQELDEDRQELPEG